MNLNITEVSIQLNRQKSGRERLNAEKISKAGAAAEYFFQGEKSRAVLTVREQGGVLIGRIKVELDNEPFRENDNLAFDEPIKIELEFDRQPERMTAMYLHRDWWTQPAFIQTFKEIPERTQSIYMEIGEGAAYLLPMAGEIYKTNACPGRAGVLTLVMTAYQSGRREAEETIFFISWGKHIYEAVEKAFCQAEKETHLPLRKDRCYPEIFEYLGWCSWDAFYTDITESKVRKKAEELGRKQVPVRWFLMDDGWLSVHGQKLYDLMPEKEKFPDGFASMIQEIKAGSTIDWFGVWHAFGGYWGGLEPESAAAGEQAHVYETANGKLLPHPTPEKGYGFFRRWYEKLRAEGIDFVKVDGQSAIKNYYENDIPVCSAAKGAHEALEGAASAYMGGRLINCMGMAMENILGRPGSGLSRNSDDFVPEDEHGFARHLIQNSYNGIYHNELYHCDWDMFWTSHPDARKHGILRAVSGGPVYFSDRIGETDKASLEPLIYRDGKILRMDRSAKPSPDCVFADPREGGLLKITNTAHYGDRQKAGAIAVYNILREAHHTSFTCGDIYDLPSGDFFLYDWKRQEGDILKKGDERTLTLLGDECALYLLIPCRDRVIPIGLLGKYISFHAVEAVLEEENSQTVILREGGLFGFFTGEKIEKIYVNGKDCTERLAEENGIWKLDTLTEGRTVISIRCRGADTSAT